MFKDYLGNIEGLKTDETSEVVELFDNGKLNFFQMKAGAEVLTKA